MYIFNFISSTCSFSVDIIFIYLIIYILFCLFAVEFCKILTACYICICMYRFNSDTGGCYLCLETEDIDAAVAKAVKAGGVRNGEKVEVDGACFGGRVEKLEDPYGNFWILCSPAANADVEA